MLVIELSFITISMFVAVIVADEHRHVLTGLGVLRSCHPSANSGSARACGQRSFRRGTCHRGKLCDGLRHNTVC